MYGCDTFLEKLGVRFLTPKVTRTPKSPNLVVPPIDETQTPAFEYREPYFTEAMDKDWAARLKTNSSMAALDDTTGGKVTYHHFVHTLDDLVPKELFATHPEYFPLVGGKRVGGYTQRCLTNPEVLKLSIESVQRWIKERPDAMIYSVSQNDCGGLCECDNCKAIMAKYGGKPSGLYIWFVNQVAEAIEKDHPDKLIDTLAYQFTEQAPTGIAPRANVRVRLCPISVCQAHPYETDTFPATKSFMATLSDWGKLSPTLYIWHYNTDFGHYLAPFPDFEEFPADIRLYKRSGVKGIFFEGDYSPGGGGSDAELRSYVMAKMMWNEKADSDALVNEWMAGVYGAAAKPMRAWFDLLHSKAKDPNAHLFCYTNPVDSPYFTDDVLVQGDQLFDEATKSAANDPVATEYVAKARLGLMYVKLVRHPSTGDDFKTFMSQVRQIRHHQHLRRPNHRCVGSGVFESSCAEVGFGVQGSEKTALPAFLH